MNINCNAHEDDLCGLHLMQFLGLARHMSLNIKWVFGKKFVVVIFVCVKFLGCYTKGKGGVAASKRI